MRQKHSNSLQSLSHSQDMQTLEQIPTKHPGTPARTTALPHPVVCPKLREVKGLLMQHWQMGCHRYPSCCMTILHVAMLAAGEVSVVKPAKNCFPAILSTTAAVDIYCFHALDWHAAA